MSGKRNKNEVDGDLNVSGTIRAGSINSADMTRVVTKVAATDLRVDEIEATSTIVLADIEALEIDIIRASVILTSSIESFTRTRAGVFTPATITFTASLPDGTPYPCRFVIKESTNGTSFTTVYTSASDEASHVHTPSATIVAVRGMVYIYAP